MTDPNAASRFDEIYSATSRSVLAFITSKCKHTADISDIFQDTYLELYQVLSNRGVDYVKSPKAFMIRIAQRKISRYYSLMERLKLFVSLTAFDEDEVGYEPSDIDAHSVLLEDFAINQLLLDFVKQHLREKPDSVKRVFYLFYEFEMTIPEIAEALGISESNVKNKLYRTLKELRELLQ